ncbi:MAG: NAD(P)/FAD-dependent oxidoreductase [Micavibrio sp.]
MMKSDVIVVGGGLAGSAAAILLRRSGKKVLLLEKEPAAHHKVCGEFISYEAAHYLNALGVNVNHLGAEPIDNVCLIHGRKSVCVKLPFQAYSLSRSVLDEALLTLAETEGVEICRGATVTGIHKAESIWKVTCATREANAKTLFLATGKHDVRGWKRPTGPKDDLIGFKIHYQLKPLQLKELSRHVEIILFKDGYAGLEPVENGKANLCLVVKKARLTACDKNWEFFLRDLLAQTPHLAHRLEGAVTDWARPLAIYGIPYGFVFKPGPSDPAGLYRLGDQIGVIPSFSGDGMSIALHTATLAVSAYLKQDSYVYHSAAKKELFPQIQHAAWLMKLISSPWNQRLLLNMCCMMPCILSFLAKKTRLRSMSPYDRV